MFFILLFKALFILSLSKTSDVALTPETFQTHSFKWLNFATRITLKRYLVGSVNVFYIVVQSFVYWSYFVVQML